MTCGIFSINRLSNQLDLVVQRETNITMQLRSFNIVHFFVQRLRGGGYVQLVSLHDARTGSDALLWRNFRLLSWPNRLRVTVLWFDNAIPEFL